jgi:hypothetical protein
MHSFNKQRFYFLRADANALGGQLQEPLKRTIPTLAPVSLPPVGGFATARSGAFTLEEIVSCSTAYTRVSGQEHPTDGSSAILVTAVVEDLNILEVVRADRIVTQLSIALPGGPGPIRISVAGSILEGLRLAGRECHPVLNPDLQRPGRADGLITWEDAWRVGRTQAKILLNDLKGREEGATYQWALRRQERMAGDPPPSGAGPARCSLIDTLETSGASHSSGHVVEIPGFGRIILGELLISPDYAQLVGVRADLGCPVRGQISVNAVGGGGAHDED